MSNRTRQRLRWRVTTAFAAAVLCACSTVPRPAERPAASPQARAAKPTPYGDEFWTIWGDGRSEVSTYDITSAAGEKGTAILVFGAAQFSRSAGVEADATRKGGSDLLPVMKLNVIRRFPSRSEMTTVFITLSELDGLPAGAVNDVTSSVQSLAGQSWSRMNLTAEHAIARTYKFREGESKRTLEYQKGTVPADVLPLVARRIAWPRLRLGQTYGVWLLRELDGTTPPAGFWATLSMTQERQTVNVPAGSFRVHMFRATAPNQPSRTWYVETEAPYRIIRWEVAGREQAGFVSSTRTKPDR